MSTEEKIANAKARGWSEVQVNKNGKITGVAPFNPHRRVVLTTVAVRREIPEADLDTATQ